MIQKLLIIFGVLSISSLNIVFAYDGSVHSIINEKVAREESQLDSTLKSKLRITEGVNAILAKDGETKRIYQWLAYGGEAEDFGRFGSLDFPRTRAFNHFHDPLQDWDEADLDNALTWMYIANYLKSPVSPLVWGFNPGQQDFLMNFTGDWSWGKARQCYYTYLTGKDFAGRTVAGDADGREAAFADCFRAVGQVMHLLQDMSVPLHTRNDAHLLPLFGVGQWTYETYTKNNVDTGKLDFSPDQPGDRPHPELIASPHPDPSYTDMVPVSGLFDRNQYQPGDPIPVGDALIGLAEYANANFFTYDSMWEYPHPSLADTNYEASVWLHPEAVDAEDGVKDNRIYFRKEAGDPVEHLMAAGYWSFPLCMSNAMEIVHSFFLDNTCFADYADQLVPRAVGYSAALLDYFFRGNMGLTVEPGTCRIGNKSEELMVGRFELYYDTVDDERKPVTGVEKWPWSYTGWISADDRGPAVDLFAVPEDALTPGDYLLVFTGHMGEENGNAVAAAKITIPAIRISLPEEGYYAFTDEHAFHDPADPKYRNDPSGRGFDKIVLNAENISPLAGDMSAGTVTLVVKYRQGLDDQFVNPPGMTSPGFSSIYAELPGYVAVPAGSSTRLEFDLTGQEIPLWATDIHLFLTYTGDVGEQQGKACLGYKDISEPTPFDFFNVMDQTCLGNTLYDAGSEAAVAFVDSNGDGIADEWDVYAHAVRDLSIKFAAGSDSTYDIPYIDAGDFFRVFVLIDYDYFDMNVGYYKTSLQADDPFTHSGYYRKVNAHHGLTNQIIKEDFAGCPSPPCLARYTSAFSRFRDINVWGGTVIVNPSYPSGSQCPYEEW